MEKEFVDYSIALDLKELGFDKRCFAYYTTHGYYNSEKELKWKRPTFSLCNGVTITNDSLTWQDDPNIILKQAIAPTFSQAFRWFRDKYDLRIWIESKSPILFEYTIATSNAVFLNMVFEDNSFYGTYEEAELECLKKLIEIVKKQK